MNRTFAKYEGLGNDFVLLHADRDDEVGAETAARLCDRRHGIGADGVLVVLPPNRSSSSARMKVVNADGSVPEMCGNGLRCVALHLARRRGTVRGALEIDTDAGTKTCEIDDAEGAGLVRVEMGRVRLTEEVELEVSGERLQLGLVDAGNPHALAFTRLDRALLERLGPQVERHPRFSHGTNFELVEVKDSLLLDVLVWERGVGPTLACGTGAVAAAVAAVSRGLAPADRPLRVRLPGGELEIVVATGGEEVSMCGPARHVFSGELAP